MSSLLGIHEMPLLKEANRHAEQVAKKSTSSAWEVTYAEVDADHLRRSSCA